MKSYVTHTRRRKALGTMLSGTVTAALTLSVAMAPTASAQPVAAAESTDVSALIRAVADATAQLDALQGELATRREAVNKTLVDLQVARYELDRAIEDAAQRASARGDAETELDGATETLRNYTGMLYRQGVAPGTGATLLAPGDAAVSGQRIELLQRASADQRVVVDELETARDAAAAEQREAEAARAAAEQRHTDAEALRDQAMADIENVEREADERSGEITALEDQLRTATAALHQQTGQQAETPADSPETLTPQVDPALAPGAGGQGPREAYQDTADVRRMADSIAGALPSHLDLGSVRDAGEALGGEIDAGSVQNVARSYAARDTDAIVDQIMGAIQRADTGSAGETAGPGTTPGGTPPSSGGSSPSTGGGAPPATGNRDIEAVIARGMSAIGLPYVWGGGGAQGPSRGIGRGYDSGLTGFDCSGLMVYSFAAAGIALPRYSGYQYTAGRQVPIAERKRGDMVFWGAGGSQHVALYLGDGKMLEAQQTGVPVLVSPLRMNGIQPFAVRMIG